MSNTSKNSNIDNLMEAVTTFVVEFLQAQESKKGKIDVAAAVQAFQQEDQQSALANIIQEKLPKKNSKVVVQKKLKDKNAPKRPASSYMFYSNAERSRVRAENPKMKLTEISKILGAGWKQLDEKGRKPYVKLAEKDKKRYETEMKTYVRPSDEELLEQKENKRRRSTGDGTKKTRKKKQAGAPKGAISAFLFFSKDMRQEVKERMNDSTAAEVSKELGRMWKEEYKGSEEGKKWILMAENDKKRAITEKKVWEEKNKNGEIEIPEPKKRGRPSKASKPDSNDEEEDKVSEVEVPSRKSPRNLPKFIADLSSPKRTVKTDVKIGNAASKKPTQHIESADSEEEQPDTEALLNEEADE
jgi:hypothetical protein